jgi:hypothetical protein
LTKNEQSFFSSKKVHATQGDYLLGDVIFIRRAAELSTLELLLKGNVHRNSMRRASIIRRRTEVSFTSTRCDILAGNNKQSLVTRNNSEVVSVEMSR